MFYDFDVVVPAGTLESAPIEQELNLSYGVIHRVEVHFPAGCRGTVYLELLHRRHQIFPTLEDQAFHGDQFPIAFNDHYELFEPPHTLVARAYSPTANHNHTIMVRIGVLHPAYLAATGVAAALKQFIGTLIPKVIKRGK